MWADILLQHPETMQELPDGIEYLNWNYRAEPNVDTDRDTYFTDSINYLLYKNDVAVDCDW